MKHRWHPTYYTKKEILEMDNHALLNAYAQAIQDETNAHNHYATGITQKQLKQHEWMYEELLSRMKK